MTAHAVPLAKVSRIPTRLKVFATLFIPLLPPLYRIRVVTALWRVLRAKVALPHSSVPTGSVLSRRTASSERDYPRLDAYACLWMPY